MKRNAKRLTLNRETVRHLNGEKLEAVQGGDSGAICQLTNTCFCPQLTQSCPTACGQWYCHGV